MTIQYVLRRIGIFLLVVWTTATINFVTPRLAPGDPIQAMLGVMQEQGATVEDSAVLIEGFRRRFGLDQPIFIQYLKYLWAMAHFDLGYSLAHFPATVTEIIGTAMPYTIGLLSVTTLLTFSIGILAGALLVWRGTARAARVLISLFMVLAPIPYYLLAMVLIFLLSFSLHIFPHSGVTSVGRVATGGFDLEYILDLIYHSTLPALSIIIAGIGGWALGMRGMMVTVLGEDYLTLAEAKGLKERRIFLRYAVRNAMLPQFTGLAISLGFIVSGATIVELIFTYPGMGYQLYQSIVNSDYPVIQGITFFLVLSVATAILIIDLIYPKLDPRITYTRR
ncbi:MAG TPA: ABC transporter permease [Caldilineae bacterium]|nr:ABC transporter permease [Caldilineae bacterium]